MAAANEQDIDSLLAEIARSQGGAASQFPSDTMTQAILERLREEVAKVYQESQGGSGGGAGDGREEGGAAEGAHASPRARVQVRHPLPVELWRRAHEVEGKAKPVRAWAAGLGVGAPGRTRVQGPALGPERMQKGGGVPPRSLHAPPALSEPTASHPIFFHLPFFTRHPRKQALKMTKTDFDGVVSRLNKAAERQQAVLLEKQRQREVEELSGLSFRPTISEHSKSIVRRRQDLGAPLRDRVEELMRLQKAKRDKAKADVERDELRELTFKPKLNPDRRGAHGGGAGADSGAGEGAEGARRTTGHLMQYDIDRRIRAEQRKMLITEMESRDLTFSPAINRNSLRIVERMKAQLAEGGGEGGGSSAGAGAGAGAGASTAPATMPHDFMPGHEQEKFKPRILQRSLSLAHARIESEGGLSVVERLYKAPPAGAAGGGSGAGGSGSVGTPGLARLQPTPLNPSDVPVVLPGVPKPWTEVAFEPRAHDFILRRLLSGVGRA